MVGTPINAENVIEKLSFVFSNAGSFKKTPKPDNGYDKFANLNEWRMYYLGVRALEELKKDLSRRQV